MEQRQHFQEDTYYPERVQTGVRIEKRLLKVLKAMAEFKDVSLSVLLEGIIVHAFEGQCVFDPTDLRKVEALQKVYGFDVDALLTGYREPNDGPKR